MEQWIPILDYAVLKGVSTSTLRRYIKSKKIQYKIENGRYLLLANEQQPLQQIQTQATTQQSWGNSGISDSISLFNRVHELETKLVKAQEQISELKMLVAIYEEQLAHKDH